MDARTWTGLEPRTVEEWWKCAMGEREAGARAGAFIQKKMQFVSVIICTTFFLRVPIDMS